MVSPKESVACLNFECPVDDVRCILDENFEMIVREALLHYIGRFSLEPLPVSWRKSHVPLRAYDTMPAKENTSAELFSLETFPGPKRMYPTTRLNSAQTTFTVGD